MTILLSSTIKLSEEVLSQEVDDEVILLDLQSEYYFGLDAVGARIWQLIQQHGNLQQVFDTMLEEYDVSEKQLENDLNDLLDMLITKGLIVIEND